MKVGNLNKEPTSRDLPVDYCEDLHRYHGDVNFGAKNPFASIRMSEPR
jgi:hypothetical protein